LGQVWRKPDFFRALAFASHLFAAAKAEIDSQWHWTDRAPGSAALTFDPRASTYPSTLA
jgi:hypothetical protein